MHSINPSIDDLAKSRSRNSGHRTASAPRIWIEVDDFLRHFDGSLTPTGIGRVQAEVFPHLVREYGERISFLRLGGDSRSIGLLDYADVARLSDGNGLLAAHAGSRWLLPPRRLARYLSRRAVTMLGELRRVGDARRFEATVRPGDILLNIGGSWTHHNFGRTVAELKHKFGMHFVLMVHDLLPVTHPQYVSPSHTPSFQRWLHSMADVVDLVLTPSRSSAQAAAEWFGSERRAGAIPVLPVRFGAGFPSVTERPDLTDPVERKHVLYVSTIEVRKNHMLLFRIWQRLISRHGPEKVPPLVFAGKYGWEIETLKSALAETRFLDGKIKVMQHLSDAELGRLYDESLFTLFPSFCEGWGLPVAESLFHGRYCIASNATSIPEVGGDFLDYHDPSDFDAACSLVEAALFEPGFLAARERRILDEYRAPGWEGTAGAIVAAIDGHLAAKPATAEKAAAIGTVAIQGLTSAGATSLP